MHASNTRRWAASAAAVALVTGACAARTTPASTLTSTSAPFGAFTSNAPTTPSSIPERLAVDVVGEYPHDPAAFTQGLERLPGDPSLVLESAGGVGTSSIRISDLDTGRVVRRVDIPGLYAMGATVVPGVGIWQLTWRNGVAVLRDPATLAELRRVRHAGEGWGTCFDGSRLIVSDGTDRLTFRDPQTFQRLGEVTVTQAGGPVTRLNELECDDGAVWANVWRKHHILRIDPSSGQVLAVVDISRIVHLENSANGPEAVPNGITIVPGTNELVLTGKLYRTSFRVRLTSAGP